MKKATNKILSLVLVVMMLMSTFAMMFAYADEQAEETITTPKAYADAEDGEKLLDVDFSKHWTVIDDSETRYDNEGTLYFKDGVTVMDPADGNIDLNEDGKVDIYGGVDNGTFPTAWNNKNVDPTGAAVIEDEGASLAVRGEIPAVGEEGQEGYVPKVNSDVTADDHRLVGQFEMYDLENKTYTYQFDAAWNVTRFKVYFANGTFVNFGGCDPWMPNLGLEVNNSGFRFRRNSADVAQNVVGKPQSVKDDNGIYHLSFKIVLSGGEKIEDLSLYNGSWTNPKETLSWKGDVIPITYSIYQSVSKTSDDGTVTVQDIRVSTGLIYQPACNELVFGIGEWTKPGTNKVYSVSNLDIYKGDTSIPFTFGFTKVYNDAGWGSELTTFDAKGITNDAYNFANGYEWTNTTYTYYDADKTAHAGTSAITVDAEGVVTINVPEGLYSKNDGATKLTGIAHGAYTNHPFGNEWNQGYYEMEMTINNASRLKLELLDIGDDSRLGFCILPNGTKASLAEGKGDPNGYLDAAASNAASRYVTSNNSFSDVLNKDYVKSIVYDTYKADDASDEDTLPQDPRNVRDYGGNRANIKIVYNCVDYVITLFEKVGGEWLPTAAIDYSDAMELGYDVGAKLGFYAYNIETNATIKNIRTMKGSSAIHQVEWNIGGEVMSFFGYDEDFQAELTEDYTEYYGLWNQEFGWTNDGKTVVEDFETLYNELAEDNYGPQTIKLAPIVKYEAKATEATLRGVQFSKVDEEKGTYDVRFVAALGDIEDIAAVGYDIVKTVNYGGYTKVTETSVETTKVCANLNLNGMPYSAEALGGKYAVAIGLEDEAALDEVMVTYTVTVYTIALDGTKTASNETVTYTFIEGEYAPIALWY